MFANGIWRNVIANELFGEVNTRCNCIDLFNLLTRSNRNKKHTFTFFLHRYRKNTKIHYTKNVNKQLQQCQKGDLFCSCNEPFFINKTDQVRIRLANRRFRICKTCQVFLYGIRTTYMFLRKRTLERWITTAFIGAPL